MSCWEVYCVSSSLCPPGTFVSCQCFLELDRFLLGEEGAKISPALLGFTYMLYNIFYFYENDSLSALAHGNLPPAMTGLSPAFLYFLLPVGSTSQPSHWPQVFASKAQIRTCDWPPNW